MLVQQLKRYRSESSLDQLGKPDPPTEQIRDEVDTKPNGGEPRRKSKDKKTATPSAATDTVKTMQPTTTTQTSRPATSARMSAR